MTTNYGAPTPDDYSDRPAIRPPYGPNYPRPIPPMPDPEPDACVGACGLTACSREDCQRCEDCGQAFDRDLEGSSCETYGPRCGDCPSVVCAGECCHDDDRAYDAWRDDCWQG